ncbi:adenylate/guanylate cyclase domain-containing protein [Arthrobacter sp. Soil764]|uniref:adenylate/guanylate cyclase domain-containing protein n=1 Tax=Arthrobacter sp. Soil764 TaxID=1736403 RepID=UPI0006F2FC9C|nr:adenylate/guanylate cyclase domain-containing protein [Arthrobacter sp. Soil764]KRE88189.1 hypothetical protein ASG86_03685 [Arthrobacter sp. Soil764]
MDSNYKAYDHVASFERLDAILAQSNSNFEEKKSLPDRDELTFDNGFYASGTALFIDIRDSSQLPDLYNRPALAKMYRAFISEMVAVFNSHPKGREINIVGDCVWGLYNTPYKSDINSVFSLAAQANSLLKVLNYKLDKAGYKTPIKCGLGAAYGRALMIKAGQKGSTISDVVYMGDVVNEAAELASQASKGTALSFLMEQDFQSNLNEANKPLTAYDLERGCFSASVINVVTEKWYSENCT